MVNKLAKPLRMFTNDCGVGYLLLRDLIEEVENCKKL